MLSEHYRKLLEICQEYRNQVRDSLRVLEEHSSPRMRMPIRLTESMEIAFYNVIDKRAERMEHAHLPADKIIQNIQSYAHKFIENHVMNDRKKEEIERFVKTYCSTYR